MKESLTAEERNKMGRRINEEQHQKKTKELMTE